MIPLLLFPLAFAVYLALVGLVFIPTGVILLLDKFHD